MSNRCLYCYLPLTQGELDFHKKCCKRFFGFPTPPKLSLDKKSLEEMAKAIVIRSVAITGVQPKLSLTIETIPGDNKNSRLTIVGVHGNYILKPQSDIHPSLPENEDLTMHLAELLDIKTAEHSLIRLESGDFAFITKRFDRIDGKKLLCEDLCQLTETLTEHKYRGSMEKVGKAIKQYSSYPLLDALSFFEITLFSFLIGNADMHLKNFSILKDKKNNYTLAPYYDLLSTELAVPEDNEEMALTITGKKNKIERKDFNNLAANLGLSEKQIDTVFKKFSNQIKNIIEFIQISFLADELKKEYLQLIKERTKKLNK